MAKAEVGDDRYEAICVNCQKRIVKRQFLGSDWWTHQPAGAAFQDGQYEFCQLRTATPPPVVSGNPPEQP